MDNITFPLTFNLQAKRNNSYNERRIEVFKDYINYIDSSKIIII